MCEWKDEWNSKSLEEKAALLARQGVRCLELLGLRLFIHCLGKLPSPGRIVINRLEISRELCNVVMLYIYYIYILHIIIYNILYLELQVREISMFFIFEGFSGFSVNFRVLSLSVNFHFPAQAFIRRALRQ